MNRYQRLFPEEVLPNDKFYIMGKTFHVGNADKLIKSIEHKLAKIDLNKLAQWFNEIKINKDYALNLKEPDLSIPGIYLKSNDFNFLIDGWHRAFNLFMDGENYMKVYVIDNLNEIEDITIK